MTHSNSCTLLARLDEVSPTKIGLRFSFWPNSTRQTLKIGWPLLSQPPICVVQKSTNSSVSSRSGVALLSLRRRRPCTSGSPLGTPPLRAAAVPDVALSNTVTPTGNRLICSLNVPMPEMVHGREGISGFRPLRPAVLLALWREGPRASPTSAPGHEGDLVLVQLPVCPKPRRESELPPSGSGRI